MDSGVPKNKAESMNSSHGPIAKGSPLKDLYPDQLLWKQFLSSQDNDPWDLPDAFKATAGLLQVLKKDEDAPSEFLPIGYAEQLIQDLESYSMPDADRQLVTANLHSLVTGEARAVVTGQQPGFSGGPLYSLLKISTVPPSGIDVLFIQLRRILLPPANSSSLL